MKSSLIVLALTLVAVDGWWCLGHMLVGHIAHKTMLPNVAQQVVSIVQTLSTCGQFPLTPDLMQVGCWADDLKAMGMYSMSSWHYVDMPYNPDNISVPEVQEVNLRTITDDMMKAARAPTKQNPWVLSYAIANLIHFFGDIHQPLHAISLYSRAFPHGDAGGNLIKVNVNQQWTNLHSVWDSICYQYADPPRPLTDADRQYVDGIADRLIATYTYSSANAKLWNTTVMAQESFDYAVKYAYMGVQPNSYLTQDYLNRCLPVAEGRITLAGLRLGNELNYLFSTFQHHEIPQVIHNRIRKHYSTLGQQRSSSRSRQA